MSNEQEQFDAIAAEAASDIESGMIVGLGNGRTARRAIEAIAARVKADGLAIQCVAASEQTGVLAGELGLSMIDFSMVEKLDYVIDGADEVDYDLRMLKCTGGSFTRERILAWAAARRVYVVAEHKLVENLGTNATFAVAVMAYGLSSTRASLRALGLHGVFRRDYEGGLFLTDNGNLVLDVTTDHPERDPSELSPQLDEIPGVIDHGLFLNECDELLVGKEDGSVERIVRQRTPVGHG